jgi:hypothetical protein
VKIWGCALDYIPEEFKSSIMENINKITPTEFINLPEDIDKEELIDPLTLDKVEENTVYAFFRENEKFYLVTSLAQIQKMVDTNFRDSVFYRVFVPTKNSLMNISELVWVQF